MKVEAEFLGAQWVDVRELANIVSSMPHYMKGRIG